MKIFQSMSLEHAKELYNNIKNENLNASLKKTMLDDLAFFTNNFSQDY